MPPLCCPGPHHRGLAAARHCRGPDGRAQRPGRIPSSRRCASARPSRPPERRDALDALRRGRRVPVRNARTADRYGPPEIARGRPVWSRSTRPMHLVLGSRLPARYSSWAASSGAGAPAGGGPRGDASRRSARTSPTGWAAGPLVVVHAWTTEPVLEAAHCVDDEKRWTGWCSGSRTARRRHRVRRTRRATRTWPTGSPGRHEGHRVPRRDVAGRARERHETFLADDVPIMVATTAFGMGIDKRNPVGQPRHAPDSHRRVPAGGGPGRPDGDPAKACLLFRTRTPDCAGSSVPAPSTPTTW